MSAFIKPGRAEERLHVSSRKNLMLPHQTAPRLGMPGLIKDVVAVVRLSQTCEQPRGTKNPACTLLIRLTRLTVPARLTCRSYPPGQLKVTANRNKSIFTHKFDTIITAIINATTVTTNKNNNKHFLRLTRVNTSSKAQVEHILHRFAHTI